MSLSDQQAHRDAILWAKVCMKTPSMRAITTPEAEREIHSPTGFSGWKRHTSCIGSVALSSLCPPSLESDDSALGNLAHAGAAEWLLRGFAPKGLASDMENYLRQYVYAIYDQLLKIKQTRGMIWMVEGRVAAPKIHKDCWGTVDSLIWHDAERVLQIHDLKYGKFAVPAKNNEQLMGYAVCARHAWPQIRPKRIELYIHQVRLSKIPDMWACDDMDLDLFEEGVVEDYERIEEQRAILKKTGDPAKLTLTAGDHCRFCPAWSTCHERIAAARREGVDLLMPVPADLPKNAPELLAFALKALPWANNFLKNAKAHLMKGGRIPGYHLKKGKRVRVAKRPESLADELTTEVDFGGFGLPADRVMKPAKLMTIPQIEEVVSTDPALKKRFGELWEWRDGAPQLAPVGDGTPYKIRPEDYFVPVLEEDETDEDESY